MPLFNNFALNVVMMSAFYLGNTLIVVDRFEAEKVLAHICRHRATYFAGTPTMYVYLLQAYDPDRHDVTTLRVVKLLPSRIGSTSYTICFSGSPGRRK